jgi:hypothetical protein
MAENDQVVLTVQTGLVTGGQNQRDYNYIGTFPGVVGTPSGLPRFAGGAPLKQAVSYANGVTAPWARRNIVFKV